MGVADLLASLEASSLAGRIRDSLYLFPLIESCHVIGLTMVFGTVSIIDLRLLGLASAGRPFSRVASDVLRWTWLAFAVAVATGSLMFITNAGVYAHNVFFQAKMTLVAVSGVNMAVFELTAGRSVDRWDRAAAPPAARVVAALSLVFWISVIFMGRWVGFTTTKAAPSADTGVDIESLLPK